MLSDSHLLRAYTIDGSQEAFGELVRRHLPLVYRSALRQLNSDTHRAQDVSQMVFLALARQARRLITHTNLSAWLYTTTHRIACQTIRTEMRRRRREQAWAMQVDTDHQSENASLWTQVAPVLDEAIRALGAKDREAVLLRFFGGRSLAQLGEAFQIGEDAARMRVNRAVDKLRELLGVRGVVVTPAALAGLLASDAALGAPAGLAYTIALSAAQTGPSAVSLAGAMAYFMAGSKLITGVVVVVAAAAVGLSTQQWNTSRVAAMELKSAQEDIASLQRRIAIAERVPRAAPVSPPTPPAAPPTLDEVWAAEREKGDRFLAAHPEVREALIQSQRARIRGKYLPLYRELKLTDAQIAEFEKTLLGATGKSWPNAGDLWVGENLSWDERESRLRALTGESWSTHYKSSPIQGNGDRMAQTLAARLAYADDPLTPEKSIAVRDIIDAARASAAGRGDGWAEALPQLASVLSRRQMDEMNAVCAQDRYRRFQSTAKTK